MMSTKVFELASDAGLWYNRTIKLFGCSDAGNTLQPEHNLIGGYAMDTVPHCAENGNLYYVYTLAYPDGRIFYVGKGRSYSNGQHDRIDDHERIARQHSLHDYNQRKSAVIREIWESGQEVVKNKVAHFVAERDAYMYEWALIYLTTYSGQLTNLKTAPFPLEKRIAPPDPDLPKTATPLCIKYKGDLVRTYHQVKDVNIFVRDHPIRKSTMRQLLEKGWTHTWEILTDCPCST